MPEQAQQFWARFSSILEQARDVSWLERNLTIRFLDETIFYIFMNFLKPFFSQESAESSLAQIFDTPTPPLPRNLSLATQLMLAWIVFQLRKFFLSSSWRLV